MENNIRSTQNDTLAFAYGSDRDVSSIIFQTRGNTWTGGLTIQARVRGGGSGVFTTSAGVTLTQQTVMPYTSIPYQNLLTLADVAAGTAITGDGLWAIRADGLEVQLVHAWTSGSVDVSILNVRG